MDAFRVAVKAFVVHEGKLLLIKRSAGDKHMPGIWEIPGGRLHSGEDPHIGLRREVKEETGLDVDVRYVLNVRHFVREDGQVITALIFICAPSEAAVAKVALGDEHDAYDWMEIPACKAKLTPLYHPEVDLYVKLDYVKLL